MALAARLDFRHGLPGVARFVRSRKAVALLLALAVVTRLLMILGSRPWQEERKYTHFVVDDARFYYWTAANLIDGYGYSASPYEPIDPTARKPPLYSLFLSAVMLTFGKSMLWVIVVQNLLQLLTLALVYFGARRLFSASTAFWLTLYCILDPVYLILSSYVYSETVYQLFHAISVYLLLQGVREGFSIRHIVAMSVCFGLALLTREIGIYFLPLVVISAGLGAKARPQALWRSVLAAACIAVVLAPWLVRNRLVFGRWSFSTLEGIVLVKFYAAPFLASQEGTDPRDVRARLLARNPEFSDPFERSAVLRRQALEIIGQEPLEYAVFHFRSVMPMLLGAYTRGLPHLLGWNGAATYVPAYSWPAGGGPPGADPERAEEWARHQRRDVRPERLQEVVKGRPGTSEPPGRSSGMGLGSGWIMLANLALLMLLYSAFAVGIRDLWRQRRYRLLLVLVGGVFYFIAITGPNSSSRYRLSLVPFLLYGAGISIHRRELRPGSDGAPTDGRQYASR